MNQESSEINQVSFCSKKFKKFNKCSNYPNHLLASAFKQQKLPAWQPILTADTVLPTFFLIGILFIPIGVGLLLSSNQVQEKIIDYTHCTSLNSNATCASVIARNASANCICEVKFSLTEDFSRDVYIYYSLTNYFQNHRRYVKSRDDSQLYGSKSISQDCEPFAYKVVNGRTMPITPCGAIANSLFNDTFRIYEDLHHFRNTFLNSGERLIDLLRVSVTLKVYRLHFLNLKFLSKDWYRMGDR